MELMDTERLQILIVEDDADLALSIGEFLEMEGMGCDYAHTGREGLELAVRDSTVSYSCIILDINIPHINGFDLCGKIRGEGLGTPVLMLTARDQLDDKLKAFDIGADDYLTKPFAMEELVARIRALAMRGRRQSMLRHGDLVMDLKTRTVTREGKPLKLNGAPWHILKMLMLQYPEPVRTQDIIRDLWAGEAPASNSLHVHFHNLRKVVDGPFEKQLIRTLPGYGISLGGD